MSDSSPVTDLRAWPGPSKVYGLCPITDRDDLRTKYRPLRQMRKDATQFGSERQISLRLERMSPHIAIAKDGKTLKSVPSKLRQDDKYKAMRAA